jgi:Zn finger protein HypA/HybF involved in hydrogenase expression
MHESIIANKILKEAKKKAKGKKIKSILIEVGDLAHLPADELKEILQTLADFEIIIKPAKAIVKCMCGYEGEPRIIAHEHDLVLFECPKCGKTPQALKGKDITLKKINTS